MKRWFGFRWFCLRHTWACFWRDLPFKIAMKLPRSIALGAFVRVHAIGETHWGFMPIYEAWQAETRRLKMGLPRPKPPTFVDTQDSPYGQQGMR